MSAFGVPSAKRSPLCHRLVSPGWSFIVYCEIDFTRRSEYESHSSEMDQKRGTLAILAPKYGSGGFVWKPNSVFQIGSFGPLMRPLARAESSTRTTLPSER